MSSIPADLDENEAKRREVVRKKKLKRLRGLAFPEADDVISKFSQVAVSKQRVSTQEQVSGLCGDPIAGAGCPDYTHTHGDLILSSRTS